MEVNVYSSIVISTVELCSLNGVPFGFCHFAILCVGVLKHVCYAHFLPFNSFSAHLFDDESSLKLDTASNYVIT